VTVGWKLKESLGSWTESRQGRNCKRRTELFCANMQRVEVIPYWSFGTTYRSHLQGSESKKEGTDRLSRNVGKVLPLHAASHRKIEQFPSTSRRKPECTLRL
jgi:hypothetical protein